tara:strand:- start:195 stop:581 length:387 start_codon:yes stop_codon:yes gene_type:complete
MNKIARIHVNQHVIKANAKNGENNPIFTIKQGGSNTYAHNVKVVGEMELVYSPDKPLSCGAKVWIETKGNIEVDGEILSGYASDNSVLTKVNPTTSLAINLEKSLKEFLSKKRRKIQNKNKLSACLSR